MALVIWCTSDPKLTQSLLCQPLRQYPDLPIKIVAEYDQIAAIQPKAVFALGGQPFETLQQLGVAPKNRKIGSLRGKVLLLPNNIRTMVSFSPQIRDVDHGLYISLLTDTGMIARLAATGSLEPKLGQYRYVTHFTELIARIKEKYTETGVPVEVALDLETVGLDEHKLPDDMAIPPHPGAYIVSIQVSCDVGKTDVVRFDNAAHERCTLADFEFASQLSFLLSSPMISMRGANLKFDLRWLWARGGFTCTNFKFDTTLVGSLLDENRSNGLDVHTKIYVPGLGGYCVAPQTRVWREDLTWSRADEIKAGEILVGFDEFPDFDVRRKMRTSEVLSTQSLTLRCYELEFSDGRKVTVSDNHAWLIHPGTNGGNLKWVATEHLECGTRMKVVTEVIEPQNTYKAGWVSGFLDGEGHVSAPKSKSRFELGWAQKPGEVWDRAAKWIGEVVPFYTWHGKSSGVLQAKVATYNSLKMLQTFRPVRLLAKRKWEGAALPQEPVPTFLTKKTLIGLHPVVSITTSTRTFVAEGLASHNSDFFDATVDKSRMDLVAPDKLLSYAGGDTDACLQVSQKMKAELLGDQRLSAFYVNILHPAARAFEVVERGGIFVDRDKFRALEADLNTEALKLVHKAKGIIGGRLVAKHKDDGKAGGMNITKASLITEYMFSKQGLNLKPHDFTPKPDKDGNRKPSTGIEHLLKFQDVPEAAEFVGCLKEYSSLTKTLNTYVVGFLKCLRSDGKLHPSYWFFVGDRDEGEGGADTGRLSAKDPAVQTIPQHTKWTPRIRECYVAPPGYKIIAKDYSQGELRVIACIANETNMIQAYLNGMDLHALTGGRVSGYTYDEVMALKKTNKEKFALIRQSGKVGNFGKIYGMGVEGFINYAYLKYGVLLTLQQSLEFEQSFFSGFPRLPEYHAEQKRFVKQHGYVRGPLGRVRHLPLINSPKHDMRAQAERQSINSPTQGTLSDMMIWAFAESQAQLPELYKNGTMMPFLACHDAGYDYILEDRAVELAKAQIEVMENLPFNKVGWKPQLKFIADAKIGNDLWNLDELKF